MSREQRYRAAHQRLKLVGGVGTAGHIGRIELRAAGRACGYVPSCDECGQASKTVIRIKSSHLKLCRKCQLQYAARPLVPAAASAPAT